MGEKTGDRPRILLCPQFTEVEWTIAGRLREWADVATYDAPGVGNEQEREAELDRPDPLEAVAARGLEEVDRLGWNSYFVVGESWGTGTAVRVATARPEAVQGLVFGHASLSHATSGERAPVARNIVDAMTQLLQTDYDSFVRYAITQLTQGGIDEETSAQIVERFPSADVATKLWDALTAPDDLIADRLRDLRVPMLFVQHQDCIAFTPEGFEDAVAAFPNARTAAVAITPTASEEFAEALRSFCGG